MRETATVTVIRSELRQMSATSSPVSPQFHPGQRRRAQLAGVRAVKFMLPGIFLLILGVGNLGVGTLKGRQYQDVLDELSILVPISELENASPMQRIQLKKQTGDRLYQRQGKARARRDFYRLVAYGGKVFMVLSAIFLIPAILIRIRNLKRSGKN